MWVKEMSFRSANNSHATKVVQDIKIMSRQSKAADTERAERATLVQQEKLIRSKSRVYRLPDLWIRPSMQTGKGRKITGTLECHQNGFRYVLQRNNELVRPLSALSWTPLFALPSHRFLVTPVVVSAPGVACHAA